MGLAGCGGLAFAQENPVTAKAIFDEMVRELTERRAKETWQPDPVRHFGMLDVKVEDWQGSEEGRFAHAIRIPNPVPADSGYRPDMTQQEYFEHLCRSEAGEFIFKTADDVEGIRLLRARRAYTSGEWQHLYALEDPYGYWIGEWENPGFEIVQPDLWAFFEMPPAGRYAYGAGMQAFLHGSLKVPPPTGATIARFSGYNNRSYDTMRLEFDTKPKARYGFTWRGVKRPMDREMGIAGGELIVLDLQTMEVMDVRRGYNVWNRGWTGRMCPRYGYLGGQDKTNGFTAWFVAKVARPPTWKEYFAERERTRRIVGDPADKRW